MERKLASIQQILNLEPIDGADRIEKATIMGWTLVVKKGEFKIGDWCVYFEIDSILPKDKEWAAFLEPLHYRVKTRKFRGMISQGLALPLGVLLKEWEHILDYDAGPRLEEDVTELLGVTKYEIPENNKGQNSFNKGLTAGDFPTHIVSKTDETRLQSAMTCLQELKKAGEFYISEKLDGTSATYCYDENEFCICGRNTKRKRFDDNPYWVAAEKNVYIKMAEKYKLEEVLANNKHIVIQGEIVGPGIQGNKLGLKEVDLFIFNVVDTRTKMNLEFFEAVTFCQDNKLNFVPVLHIIEDELLENFDYSLSNFLELAKGKYPNTKTNREGIVVRPLVPTYSNKLKGPLSFKVINNDFLLKEEE